MNGHRKTIRLQNAELNAELEQEIARLANRARRENSVEAVMRLRALTEIAGGLDTDRLVALAVWVSTQPGDSVPVKLAS